MGTEEEFHVNVIFFITLLIAAVSCVTPFDCNLLHVYLVSMDIEIIAIICSSLSLQQTISALILTLYFILLQNG